MDWIMEMATTMRGFKRGLPAGGWLPGVIIGCARGLVWYVSRQYVVGKISNEEGPATVGGPYSQPKNTD